MDPQDDLRARAEEFANRSRERYIHGRRVWIGVKCAAGTMALAGLLAELRAFWPFNFLILACLVAVWVSTWSAIAKTRLRPTPASSRNPARDEYDEDWAPSEQELEVQQTLRTSARTLDRCYFYWQGSLVAATVCSLIGVSSFAWIGIAAMLNIGVSCLAGAGAMRHFRIRGDRAALQVRDTIEKAGPEVIGAVIDFIASADESHHEHAYNALDRLVGRVRASHGPSIRPAHRRFLYRMLKPDQAIQNRGRASAILRMVEELADPAAEPFLLELLATLDPKADGKLLEAANYALQAIGMADATLGQRGVLLSPAGAPGAQRETLLRPAASGSQQPAEQLLRTVDESSLK
jgi:hypothetical protein